ncbi:MAG: GMP synthase subunit A [Thermoplasmata archaeon]
MKISVIDNGGQWTHREWRVLRDIGVETEIIPNTTPLAEIDSDGLVLSGGAPRVGLDVDKMGKNGEYLEKGEIPILGICAGHQFMAIFFGGKAEASGTPEFGKATIVVEEEDDLFVGLPKKFEAWESHNDEVSELPPDFIVLAHSDNCPVQSMKHVKKPFYGVQFHPEVEHTEHGYDIFRNFIGVCEEE